MLDGNSCLGSDDNPTCREIEANMRRWGAAPDVHRPSGMATGGSTTGL